MKAEKTVSAEEQQARKRKYTNLLILLTIMLAVSVFSFVRSENAVSFQWTEAQVTITDPAGGSFTIRYDAVTEARLAEDADFGVCLDGGKKAGFHYGQWKSPLWGTYTRCTSELADNCIVLKTAAEVFVLSYESDQTTADLYESILSLLKAQ